MRPLRLKAPQIIEMPARGVRRNLLLLILAVMSGVFPLSRRVVGRLVAKAFHVRAVFTFARVRTHFGLLFRS